MTLAELEKLRGAGYVSPAGVCGGGGAGSVALAAGAAAAGYLASVAAGRRLPGVKRAQ